MSKRALLENINPGSKISFTLECEAVFVGCQKATDGGVIATVEKPKQKKHLLADQLKIKFDGNERLNYEGFSVRDSNKLNELSDSEAAMLLRQLQKRLTSKTAPKAEGAKA